ncbi:MAG: hypothetical protein JRH11_15010 [Deltaproteobacteria bacterium]|nr:hypothetical protein [Deltaproteobacteria bacterium]
MSHLSIGQTGQIGPGAAVAAPEGTPGAREGRGAFGEALAEAARSIMHGQRRLDAAVRGGRGGRVLSNEDILSLQASVYRYTQELEIASKLVDKATSAVRTTLQSQQ